MPRITVLALLMVVVLAACQTTTKRRLSFSPDAEVRVASPTRAWEVRAGEATIGVVVFFEAQGPAQDSLFMVRNVWHQDLGLIDAYGRAYRYMPHHKEPAWVGSGTVSRGVERILDVASCTLAEIPFPIEAGPLSPGELEQRRINAPNSLSFDS